MADGDEHKRRRMIGQFTSEVSQTNPRTNTNIFNFGLNACKLKRALAPIVDAEFNPRGLARLDVDSFGIEFTVHNVTTQVTARLKLKHGFLDGFFFFVPETATPRSYKLENVVNVKDIAEILKHFDDDDFVNVCCCTHISGEKQLLFSSRKDPSKNQSVLLVEPDINYEYLKFSRFYSREVEIPKTQLSFIVDQPLQAGKPRRVLIDVTTHPSTVVVGEDNTENNIHNVQGEQGQFEGALFDWTHVESLHKASSLLESEFYLRILIGREPNGILLRINLVGLGELHYYLSESVRVFRAGNY